MHAHLLIGVHVSETEPREAWTQQLMLGQELRLHGSCIPHGKTQEALAVRAGALASPPSLHPEQVIQERAYEVVVQESATHRVHSSRERAYLQVQRHEPFRRSGWVSPY